MFIGDTSARVNASGLPFIEIAEILIDAHSPPGSSEPDSDRPQSAQPVCGLRTGPIRPPIDPRMLSMKVADTGMFPVGSPVAYHMAGVLDRSRS